MPSHYTPNFNLSQWEKTDKVQMEDFNADNAKLDAALAQIPYITFGAYAGNNEESRLIELGFTPKAVFVCRETGQTIDGSDTNWHCGGFAWEGHPCATKIGPVITIEENGFRVYCLYGGAPYQSNVTNSVEWKYFYVAVH